MGFPNGSVVKNLPAKAGDVGLISSLERSRMQRATKAVSRSYRACALLEPRSCDCWSLRAPDTVLCSKSSHCDEKPADHSYGEAPTLYNQQKAHAVLKTRSSQKKKKRLYAWFYLHEIHKRVKLIYKNGSLNCGYPCWEARTSHVAQTVKNLPATWETQVRSLGLEDPLEKGMATHSSVLAWRIPRTRGDWWATVHGVSKSRTRLIN